MTTTTTTMRNMSQPVKAEPTSHGDHFSRGHLLPVGECSTCDRILAFRIAAKATQIRYPASKPMDPSAFAKTDQMMREMPKTRAS